MNHNKQSNYSDAFYHERRNSKIEKIKVDRVKLILRTILGSIVEYYDFGLYAFFAPMIGHLFFASNDAFVQILASLGVFAVGFLMRPVGAIAFGYIGDKIGRKIALRIAVIGMSAATLAIGLLPTYETIGVFAPIFLVLIRLIQGLCIGGEGTGSAIFILEHLSGRRFGFVGSIVMVANILGTLLASLIVIILDNTIGVDDFTWRIGFFAGFVMGLVAIYFRHKTDESPVFRRYHKDLIFDKETVSPIRMVFKHHGIALLQVFILASAATTVAYFLRGYLFTYLVEMIGLSSFYAQYLTFFALLMIVVMLPVFSVIAERVGYDRYLFIVASCILLSIFPLFKLISKAYEVSSYFAPIIAISTLCAAMSAPAYPYAIAAFPPQARYTGVALGWNLGNAFCGGATPFICGYLSQFYGKEAPAYYIFCVVSCFLLIHTGIIFIRSLKRAEA